MAKRTSLANVIVEDLLEQVFSGELTPGNAILSESDIARAHNVSRVTVREALKNLEARNVVTIRRGVGTFVNPPQSWTSLETVLRFASRTESSAMAAVHLIEVRRIIETGAAALAARNRTEEELDQLTILLNEMVKASGRNDVDAFVQADIAFHDVILRASRNLFVPVLFEPLSRLLYEGRARTSAVPQIQRNAIKKHRKVITALQSGDPEQSRVAMDQHMSQTVHDLTTMVLCKCPEAKS